MSVIESKLPKYKCKVCQDVIQSRYNGEFVTCKCWQSTMSIYNKEVKKLQRILPNLDEVSMELLKSHLYKQHHTGLAIDCTNEYCRVITSTGYEKVE